MYSKINWALLAKYLANECNEEEKRLVQSWLEADPLNRELFEYIKSTWKASSDKPVLWDVDSAWSNVALKLGIESGNRQVFPRKVSYKDNPGKITLPASRFLSSVVLIVIISVASLLYKNLNKEPVKIMSLGDQITFHEMSAEKGQRVSFKLSDGSEVFLNSASTIRFPEKFSNSKRLVYLDGEAYFKVVHNDEKPFKVIISDGEVTDIGTEFNVRAWKNENVSSVTVKEGKVSFGTENVDGNNIVYLTKNETSSLSDEGKLSPPVVTRVDRQISWLNGKIYFENSTLGDVFNSLDRSYNFHCSVNDSSLLSMHLTAVLKGDNFREVVNIISLALDLRYEISEKSCLFSAKKIKIKNKNRHQFSN